jgi:DNA helicase-2/ATP-dependent DNA helicase PcrA
MIEDQTSHESTCKFDLEDIDAFYLTGTAPGKDSFSFSSGEVVRHPVFGIGRILEIYGIKEKVSAKVSFNIGGTKHLMLAYAKLEKIK